MPTPSSSPDAAIDEEAMSTASSGIPDVVARSPSLLSSNPLRACTPSPVPPMVADFYPPIDTLAVPLDAFYPATPSSVPPRPSETFTIDIGPPGEAVVVRMSTRDLLQYPDSLLCKYFQNRDTFRAGDSFDRDPQLFLQSVKPFYEKGFIPALCAAHVPLIEEEFAYFGLPFDTDLVVLPKVGETVCFRFNQFVLRLYHQRMMPVLQRRIKELKGSHEFTVQELGMETVEPDFFQKVFTSSPYCFQVMCKFEKRQESFVNIFQVSIPIKPVEGSEAHKLWLALNVNIDATVNQLVQALMKRTGADWLASPFALQQVCPQAPDRHCSDIIIRKLKAEHQVQVEEWGISPFPPSVLCSSTCPHSPPCPGTCDGNSVPEVHQRTATG
eukprot:GGOE01045609.1.p1 GENE.GGOE01045609.1~~GGOE01045609.1.p1  ORF type:complete len:425 (+),score=129.22 GGOE01045609.1:126-1277(+)